ncbi:MAG: hypothetical protein CMN93_08360 [Synechococcus sp. CPC35]|nr:hypothetical protein [Synechococcus sp. CPC35]
MITSLYVKKESCQLGRACHPFLELFQEQSFFDEKIEPPIDDSALFEDPALSKNSHLTQCLASLMD